MTSCASVIFGKRFFSELSLNTVETNMLLAVHQSYFGKQRFSDCIFNMFQTIILLVVHQPYLKNKMSLLSF